MIHSQSFSSLLQYTFDSSVGRAVDCSCSTSEIHRSLVQIRLEGFFTSDVKLYVNIHFCFNHVFQHQFLDSLVVRISACHVEGPGSIPGRGECFWFEIREVVKNIGS